MPYSISRAHRNGRCKYCTNGIERGTIKIANHIYKSRGKKGSLNFENSYQFHVKCLTHNLALNMCEDDELSDNVTFYCHPDEAREVAELIKHLAFGFDASQLRPKRQRVDSSD